MEFLSAVLNGVFELSFLVEVLSAVSQYSFSVEFSTRFFDWSL